MKSILQGCNSLCASFILRRWKNRRESDVEGCYSVSHHYELVGGGIYVDLYWYVHDTKHSRDDPKYHKTITVYDRVPLNEVGRGIKRVEAGELRSAVDEMLRRDDG